MGVISQKNSLKSLKIGTTVQRILKCLAENGFRIKFFCGGWSSPLRNRISELIRQHLNCCNYPFSEVPEFLVKRVPIYLYLYSL